MEFFKLQDAKALIKTEMTLKLNPEKVRRKRALDFTKDDFATMAALKTQLLLHEEGGGKNLKNLYNRAIVLYES